MESESEHDLHTGVHHVVDSDDGDDLGSEEPQTLEPPVPQLIGLVVIFLLTLVTIYAGYIHGNMHLITTLKNATHS